MIACHKISLPRYIQLGSLQRSGGPMPASVRCHSHWTSSTAVQTQQQQTTTLSPLRPDEVWYFAYGSNMNPKTLTNRRMVRPRQSVPCMVPDHSLSFDVLGFPYAEPGFATIVHLTQEQQQRLVHQLDRLQQNAKQFAKRRYSEHSPCVHGVLHRVTKKEWAFVQATEGVSNTGVGYQVANVTCHLYDGKTVVQAQTLKSAAASMHSSSRQVLPSQRYLWLLQEGARHHQLDPGYQQWLASLQSYQSPGVLQQALGTVASGAVLAAAAAPAVPVYMASRALGLLPQPEPSSDAVAAVLGTTTGPGTCSSHADTNPSGSARGVVPFFSWYANQAQNVTWWVHDNIMCSVLGSGCGDGNVDAHNRLQ